MSDTYDDGLVNLKNALALTSVIESLKLPKSTRLVGTKEGLEVHRKDGISYRLQLITPRYAKDNA